MAYSELLALFGSIATLEESEIQLIQESFKPMTVEKGEFFLRAGEVNKYVGYLCNGLVRYFVYKDGDESTFEFTRAGEFIADYQSFNNHKVSQQNIQAIEESELLVINYPAVQRIFNSTKNGNLIGRKIIEHRFDIMVNQLLSVHMENPEDRYRNFVSKYSDLSMRIPQYLIASYVGVKPPSLSRIRRRFADERS